MRRAMILMPVLILALIAYTSWRIYRILPLSPLGKSILTGIYILCFLVIIPHFAWGDKMPAWLAVATYETGTSWMIFFLYALLIFLALGLGRILHLVPANLLKDSLTGSCIVFGAIIAILLYGNLHYHHKYREEIEISTSKPVEKPLTIVLASDLHAGYHNRAPELRRWVNMINAEKPDLVLFAGDVLDGALRPAKEWNYAEIFREIEAPVFACLGNHEYLSGKEGSAAFFKDAGIGLLMDSTAVAEGIRIIGRDDRSNPSRLPLEELVPDDSLFTILLDHQPYHLEEAENCGVEFQFSGHTHRGQVWPGNLVTRAIYEKDFGHYARGGTRYYVSSGLGIWGGKFRIATRSEYIVLKIKGSTL